VEDFEDNLRSEAGDRGQSTDTNGGEEGRQDRRKKGRVSTSIYNKLGIGKISNVTYGREEGQCRRNSLGGEILPGKVFVGKRKL
jgi:hypothetical protein